MNGTAILASLGAAAPAAAPAGSDMTLGGWIFMLGSVGTVLVLAGYCFWKVLATPGSEERLHAPLDIDTRDRGS